MRAIMDLVRRLFARRLRAGPAAPAPVPPATPRGTVGRESIAWRGRNPGNLRVPRTWTPEGLAGTIVSRSSGTFCLFATERHGWQALATRILQLHRQGRRSVRAIISIWAPPIENDTHAYVLGVARALNVSPDAAVDVTRLQVMNALAEAIRRHEGKPTDPPWDEAERRAGLLAAGVLDGHPSRARDGSLR
jgi:AcrR family transcriptional regulator